MSSLFTDMVFKCYRCFVTFMVMLEILVIVQICVGYCAGLTVDSNRARIFRVDETSFGL